MDDQTVDSSAIDIHEPFTVKEHFDQLSQIDKDITTLLRTTATALESLARPDLSTPDPTQTFKDSMDKFLATLHSVDVRLKREVWALEEAGIVTLPEETKQVPIGAPVKTSLEPDGAGKVGKLDVGWLNSRSNKVERDMEKELWAKAREALEGREGGVEMKDEGVA